MSTTQWITVACLALSVFETVLGLAIQAPRMVKYEGENFFVSCTDLPRNTITWSGPSGVKYSSRTQPYVELGAGGMMSMLHFKDATVDLNGNYTCSTKTESKIVQVIIKVPLVFVDTPLMQTAVEKQKQFIIKCEVKGGVKPVVTWATQYGELTSKSKPKYTILADGLLLTDVTIQDASLYICRATEKATGDTNSANITLTVQHKPYPKDDVAWVTHEDAWGFVDSVVNLTCEAKAEPPPKFEWRQPVKNHGILLNDTFTSILQVNITDETVFGNYSCKVFNKLGVLNKTITLQKGEQPKPPSLVTQQGENSDLLDIRIDPPTSPTEGLMAPTGFLVQYRLEGKHGNNTWQEHQFNITEKNSYILRNLEPNSKYDIRVATKNAAGLSDFTNATKFFTLEDAESASTSVLAKGALDVFSRLLLSVVAASVVFNW